MQLGKVTHLISFVSLYLPNAQSWGNRHFAGDDASVSGFLSCLLWMSLKSRVSFTIPATQMKLLRVPFVKRKIVQTRFPPLRQVPWR